MIDALINTVFFAVAIYILMWLTILVHELGHAISMIVMRVPVYRFTVGGGKRLDFQFMGVEYRLGWYPSHGEVLARRSVDWFKTVVTSACGPAINLLIFIGCIIALGMGKGGVLTGLFAMLNLVAGFRSLVPDGQKNDGAIIEKTLRRKKAREDDFRRTYGDT